MSDVANTIREDHMISGRKMTTIHFDSPGHASKFVPFVVKMGFSFSYMPATCPMGDMCAIAHTEHIIMFPLDADKLYAAFNKLGAVTEHPYESGMSTQGAAGDTL